MFKSYFVIFQGYAKGKCPGNKVHLEAIQNLWKKDLSLRMSN